jgi:DNA-binding CsgD family transcriptional regulator
MGSADQVVLAHASLTREGAAGGVAFALSARQVDETARVTARLQRLAPHLSRALDFTLQLGRHQSGAWQVDRVLAALPGAVLLLNRWGGIVRTNEAADALLRQGDGITAVKTDQVRLATHSRIETRRLTQFVGRALAAARGEEQGLDAALHITRPSGRPPFLLLLTPLPPPSFSLWEAVDGGARVLVQIVDLHASASAQAERLQTAAGLTPAETRVAALVGGGLSAPEAASVLGLSLATVKTHLARCFDKTGARSQATLARLLATLPPTPSKKIKP